MDMGRRLSSKLRMESLYLGTGRHRVTTASSRPYRKEMNRTQLQRTHMTSNDTTPTTSQEPTIVTEAINTHNYFMQSMTGWFAVVASRPEQDVLIDDLQGAGTILTFSLPASSAYSFSTAITPSMIHLEAIQAPEFMRAYQQGKILVVITLITPGNLTILLRATEPYPVVLEESIRIVLSSEAITPQPLNDLVMSCTITVPFTQLTAHTKLVQQASATSISAAMAVSTMCGGVGDVLALTTLSATLRNIDCRTDDSPMIDAIFQFVNVLSGSLTTTVYLGSALGLVALLAGLSILHLFFILFRWKKNRQPPESLKVTAYKNKFPAYPLVGMTWFFGPLVMASTYVTLWGESGWEKALGVIVFAIALGLPTCAVYVTTFDFHAKLEEAENFHRHRRGFLSSLFTMLTESQYTWSDNDPDHIGFCKGFDVLFGWFRSKRQWYVVVEISCAFLMSTTAAIPTPTVSVCSLTSIAYLSIIGTTWVLLVWLNPYHTRISAVHAVVNLSLQLISCGVVLVMRYTKDRQTTQVLYFVASVVVLAAVAVSNFFTVLTIVKILKRLFNKIFGRREKKLNRVELTLEESEMADKLTRTLIDRDEEEEEADTITFKERPDRELIEVSIEEDDGGLVRGDALPKSMSSSSVAGRGISLLQDDAESNDASALGVIDDSDTDNKSHAVAMIDEVDVLEDSIDLPSQSSSSMPNRRTSRRLGKTMSVVMPKTTKGVVYSDDMI